MFTGDTSTVLIGFISAYIPLIIMAVLLNSYGPMVLLGLIVCAAVAIIAAIGLSAPVKGKDTRVLCEACLGYVTEEICLQCPTCRGEVDQNMQEEFLDQIEEPVSGADSDEGSRKRSEPEPLVDCSATEDIKAQEREESLQQYSSDNAIEEACPDMELAAVKCRDGSDSSSSSESSDHKVDNGENWCETAAELALQDKYVEIIRRVCRERDGVESGVSLSSNNSEESFDTAARRGQKGEFTAIINRLYRDVRGSLSSSSDEEMEEVDSEGAGGWPETPAERSQLEEYAAIVNRLCKDVVDGADAYAVAQSQDGADWSETAEELRQQHTYAGIIHRLCRDTPDER